jgi:hypothetical protein
MSRMDKVLFGKKKLKKKSSYIIFRARLHAMLILLKIHVIRLYVLRIYVNLIYWFIEKLCQFTTEKKYILYELISSFYIMVLIFTACFNTIVAE